MKSLSLENAPRDIQELAILLCAYTKCQGREGERIDIVEGLAPDLGLGHVKVYELTEFMSIPRGLLQGVGGLVELTFKGLQKAQATLLKWSSSPGSNTPLSTHCTTALPIAQSRAHDRYRLCQYVRDRYENVQLGWVSFEDIFKEMGRPRFDAALYFLIKEQTLRVPESWSVTFTEEGLERFDLQQSALREAGVPAHPNPEELWTGLAKLEGYDAPSVTKGPFFPTPEGTRWEDVSIKFKDRHNITISVGSLRKVYHYSELHMADKRTNDPDSQWQFLEDLIESSGAFGWDHALSDKKRKKHKQRLSETLRKLMGIQDDPIPWVTKERARGQGCWEARFKIKDPP